jgi:hypothetical protein
MPDRVAFIGGSTWGRDHFPFPTYQITPSETVYPIGISFEAAMSWIWRVKTWKIEGTIGFTVDGTYGFLANIYNTNRSSSVRANPLGGAGIPITSESGLVCQPIITGFEPFDYDINNPIPDTIEPTFEYFVVNLFQEFLLPLGYHESAGPYHFWPSINVDFRLGGDSGGEGFQIDGGTAHPTGEIVTGTPFTIDGWEVSPIKCLVSGAVDAESVAISLAMTPIEFWPYATKSGLPVYNTATGEQLRDPLS